jgi:hypothetical protein
MTVADLYAFAEERHGKTAWIGPLAEETGYSFSGMYRLTMRAGDSLIPARLEREVERLDEQAEIA